MTKNTVYLALFALTTWLAAFGYGEYSERKPWSTENGSVHLADCSANHDECDLEGRIERVWNSDVYVLTTPAGNEHEFTWNDISTMNHPTPTADQRK